MVAVRESDLRLKGCKQQEIENSWIFKKFDNFSLTFTDDLCPYIFLPTV